MCCKEPQSKTQSQSNQDRCAISKTPLTLQIGKTYWDKSGNLILITAFDGPYYDGEKWVDVFQDVTGNRYLADGSPLSPYTYGLIEEFQHHDEVSEKDWVKDLIKRFDKSPSKGLYEKFVEPIPKDETFGGFLKYSDDKTDLTYLLDFKTELDGMCRVLMFGAKKYNRDNWKKGSTEVYKKAFLRHMLEMDGIEPETGLSHKYNMIINLFYLLYFENKGKV